MRNDETLLGAWEEHMASEFAAKSPDHAIATMAEDPYVNTVALMIGGRGRDEVRAFYADHFLSQIPPDTEMVPVSPAKFERHGLFALRTPVETGAVAVFRARQGLVTAARHVRSPTRGLAALAHNENTAEQVEHQPADAHFASSQCVSAATCLSKFMDPDPARSSPRPLPPALRVSVR